MKYPRFEKYKDSSIEWIGQIPESWELFRLKELSTIFGRIGFRGYSQEDIVDFEEGAITVSPSNMQNGKLNFIKNTYLSWHKYNESPEIKLNPGDIIMVKTGSTIGKVSYAESINYPSTINPQLMIFKKIKCHKKFLFYYLYGDNIQSIIPLHNSGSTIPTMTQESIGKLPIPIPPIDIQQAIANFLDNETTRLDALISKKQQLIETLKEKRIAIISSAVTKGLNPDVPMKDSGIEWLGEVPEHWEVKRLKYISKINPVASEIKHLELSDEVSFVPMESISENGGMRTNKTKELDTVRQGFTYFRENDVVIAKITPCFENGKGSIAQNLVNNIGFGTTELHVVRCNPELLDYKFFFYISNTHQFLKLGESEMFGAGGQKRVPTEFVKNFPIAYPIEMNEQMRIVQFLDKYIGQILSIIDRTQKTISKLQEYKTALISAAVTGKIKVPEQA